MTASRPHKCKSLTCHNPTWSRYCPACIEAQHEAVLEAYAPRKAARDGRTAESDAPESFLPHATATDGLERRVKSRDGNMNEHHEARLRKIRLRCLRCKYDVTEQAIAGIVRCPECGESLPDITKSGNPLLTWSLATTHLTRQKPEQ